MNELLIDQRTNTVTYGNKNYRVQNDRGHLHIVITENGQRKKLTVKHKPEIKYNVFYHYVLEGVQQTHPCVVMEWWLKMYIANKKLPINVMYKK